MTTPTKAPGKPRGFAAMSPERQREIASMGGKQAQRDGKAYRFTSETARVAGTKGGKVSGKRRTTTA